MLLARPRARLFSLPLLCAGLLLVILGGKFWLIEQAGIDLPNWDQWDGEAAMTFLPWLQGDLGPAQIFHPHNEHRIVTTKLYALGLFVANGQWSAALETVANAVLHALSALVLWLVSRRWLERRWWLAFGAVLLLLFSLPFSWENTIAGFQAQFYFLQLFSLAHVWLLLGDNRSSLRWILGQICGILALLTMASGFFSALAVFAVIVFRATQNRRIGRREIATLFCCLAMGIIGWMMRNHVSGHDGLKAQGMWEFFTGLLQLFAWPGTAAFPAALLLAAPLLVFVVRVLRRPAAPADSVMLGFIVWICLQFGAIAYARGGDGGPAILASRYLDLAACNVALCFVVIAREFDGRLRPTVAGVWSLAIVGGLGQQSLQHWREFIVPTMARHEHQVENVRAYLATGEPSHLLDKPWGHVPYPEGERLLAILESPQLQAIMPPSVRRPVPLHGEPARSTALPAALKPPPLPVAFSSYQDGTEPVTVWRSQKQSNATLPILRFRIAGNLQPNSRGLGLVLKSAAGEVPVIPDAEPKVRWKTVAVVRPPGPWWIEAADQDPNGWFAFTEPVELGYGTWLAEKLIKHYAAALGSGIVLLMVGGVLAAADGRARRHEAVHLVTATRV